MESDTPGPTQSITSTSPFSSPKVNIAVDSTESSTKTNLKSQAVTSELQSPVDDEGPIQTLPFLDESVAGYVDDVTPEKGGRKYILEVVQGLQSGGIPSCLVQNAALIYYGALRNRWEWVLCVPDDWLDNIVSRLDESKQWERCKPSAMKSLGEINDLYPRFKVTGVVCFLVILSAKNCHLPCTFETIEYGQSGLPFPKLDTFAQCLLDTGNDVELDDLIDGMNLIPEWGEQHLDLSGNVDVDWAKWRNEKLSQLYGKQNNLWPESRRSLRELWMSESSTDRKRRGQGWKYNEAMETRFWRRGQKDPRQRPGWY